MGNDPVEYPPLDSDTNNYPSKYCFWHFSENYIIDYENCLELLDGKFEKATLQKLLGPILVTSKVKNILKPVCVKLLNDYIFLLLLEGFVEEFDTLMGEINSCIMWIFSRNRYAFFTHDVYKCAQVLIDASSSLIAGDIEWPPVRPINIVSRLTPALLLDLVPQMSILKIEFTIPHEAPAYDDTKRRYFLYCAELSDSCEGMEEYLEFKEHNAAILGGIFNPTREELENMLVLSEEKKQSILRNKEQYRLFASNTSCPKVLPTPQEREALKKKLKYPQKKLKPTQENIKWECMNEVHYLVNGQSIVHSSRGFSSIMPISLDHLKFGGAVNVLLIEIGENTSAMVQLIEADVDMATWKVANPVKKENIDRSEVILSLCCQITKDRMKTPVRSHACEHLECFERTSLSSLKRELGTFECPHCKQIRNISDLIEPPLLKDILGKTDSTVKEVLVSEKTLKWRLKEALSNKEKQKENSESKSKRVRVSRRQ